jgi:hypothetical protein
VSFNKILGDLRRMTGSQIRRHPKPSLDRVEICRLNRLHCEASFLQVPDPAGATSAIWILVNCDDLILSSPGAGQRECRSAGQQDESRAARERCAMGHGDASFNQ